MAVILALVHKTNATEILAGLQQLSQNWHNRRVLHRIQVPRVLLKMLRFLPADLYAGVFSVVENVVAYSISDSESELLLDLAEDPAFSDLANDLINNCLKTSSPDAFYAFEETLAGTAADATANCTTAIESEAISNLPKSGYTLMFWVRVGSPFDQVLFEWVDHRKGIVLL
jgi:hypothetical protein